MLLQPIDTAADGLRAELRIEAPVATVFRYISDLRTMVSWWPEHPVYRRLTGDGGAGSLYAWVYRVGIFPVAAGLTRVLVRDPGERFEYRAGPPFVGLRIGYRFTPDGEATRVGFSFLSPLARSSRFGEHLIPEVTRAFERLDAAFSRAG